jgi:uncharacterized protein (DUF362 family)
MKRRDFFKRSAAFGLTAGAALSTGSISNIFAETNNLSFEGTKLVAVKGGEADAMFLRGMQELGGIKAFVKPNQTVVIKPNVGWDVQPERAANTNPALVKQIIKSCLEAGAKEVYVFDHTCDNWKRCYKNSGIENAVSEAGGTMVPGNNEKYYQEVTIPAGKKLKSAKVHELILESDVFINVPILKDHDSARLTIGMKNHMGIVWDRGYWHRNDLHQCIADFASFKKPDLTIVDAYNILKRNGPRGVSSKDVVPLQSQIITTDFVAADAAAAKLFGLEPEQVPYISYAHDMNLGTKNLQDLSISRIKM